MQAGFPIDKGLFMVFKEKEESRDSKEANSSILNPVKTGKSKKTTGKWPNAKILCHLFVSGTENWDMVGTRIFSSYCNVRGA